MVEPLEGNELRVFRCLIEGEAESLRDIYTEMTRQPALLWDEVEEALEGLRSRGFAEEFKPDHWRRSDKGYYVRRSLLGELSAQRTDS